MGDGNINFVYIVEGPSGNVVVKQGLPYIRIAQDWALTQVHLHAPRKDGSRHFLESRSGNLWPVRFTSPLLFE